MTESGRASRKSRAPYFLVGAVCIAIIAAAFLTNSFKRGTAEAVAIPAGAAGQATPVMGAPPARSDNLSVAERTAAMTTSRHARREERKQKIDEARLAMADRFEQEAVDAAWSAGKETSLQALAQAPTYEQAGAVPDRLQIDCRSTLCKITASHGSYGASADWAMIFMTSSAGEIKRTFTKTINNPDGTTSVEIHAQAR